MKPKLSLTIVLAFSGLVSFAQTSKGLPDKIIDKIVGVWKIQKITSGKNEVMKNPTSGQWIEFRSDGTYLNHSTSIDSGSYRIKEDQATLYLESDASADPSKNTSKQITEWSVAFEQAVMVMQRRSTGRHEHVDRMVYYYAKVGKQEDAVNN